MPAGSPSPAFAVPPGPAPTAAAWMLCLGSVVLGGCAQPVRVHTLATGQPDRVAYELFGHNLTELRAHASQLCPHGGEVVRAAEVRQSNTSSPLPALRWAEEKASRVLPPPGSAQLVVTCDAPGRQVLAALPPPTPAASAAPRKPLFKLGGSDGPGVFSRLGGAVGAWWGAAPAGATPTPVGASDARPADGRQGMAGGHGNVKPGSDQPMSEKPHSPAAANTSSAPRRAPAPVTGYDD